MLPNQTQEATLEEWLVTLRKHRNYALRERIDGFETNNQNVDESVAYSYGAYCEIDSKVEYGSCCPLTCPVLKHGVIPQNLELATKQTKIKDKQTNVVIETVVKWDSASGIQMKVTSQLRQSLESFAVIDSCTLQRNITNLDTAFTNFWKHGRGFPQFIRRLDSFEYKPGRVILRHIRKKYATAYLPGIGEVKFHNSRDLSQIQDLRTCTIKREGGNWYISMLVNIADTLPELKPLSECKSVVGIDVGINKLVALSDGSFVENKRPTTNPRTARRLAMRQRAITRKQKGSKNRIKAIKKLALQLHKLAQYHNGYGWQVASKIVKTADVVSREDLRIKNMVKRAKPKHDGKGGYKRNGASRKTGLNRVILDAGWGDIFNKIAWLAVKSGKQVIPVPAKHTSLECPSCGHIDKKNRLGEKFLCIVCNFTEHADTKASRTIALRVGLVFPNKKTLPADCGKVTPSRYQSIVIETGNQAYGIENYPTIGYLGDTAETPRIIPLPLGMGSVKDVQPTDWAFQTLQSLVERYGCIQGYPNQTYRGNRSLTRYEFAAGINACLDRMNELIATSTAELVRKQDLLAVQKLQKEFATELATLRNRVDAVEVSTSSLEQHQFSTTTKLAGEAVFAPVKVFGNDSDKNDTVLQERVFLSLVTSFTGKDQLTTLLAAGNTPVNSYAFNWPGVNLGGVLPVSTAEGTLTHQSGGNFNNSFYLYAAEYRFPVGDRLTAFLEGYGGVTYYVAPTFNSYLDYQDFGKGAISAFGQRSPIYRLGGGSGIGLNYKLTEQITLSGVYLSDLFTANNPTPGFGLFQSGYTALGQISWNPNKNFGIGLTYVNSYFLPGEFGFNNYGGLQLTGTAVANTLAGQTSLNLISQPEQPVVMNSYGVELSYQFSPKFAISGWFGASYPRLINRGDGEILYYALTLNFPDFARKGNLLAFVIGAEPYLTHFNGGNPQPFKTDIPLHIEALYQYQLTPNISLTPGLVWLTAPNQDNRHGSDVITTLRATFSF